MEFNLILSTFAVSFRILDISEQLILRSMILDTFVQFNTQFMIYIENFAFGVPVFDVINRIFLGLIVYYHISRISGSVQRDS